MYLDIFYKTIGNCRTNVIIDLLIPFIFFNIIWYVSIGNFNFPIYYAGWTLWYLLSLFFWRFFLKDIIKVKWVIRLSIILGLFVGFSDKYIELLSFSRTFAFLPYFLLGYYSNKSTINKIKKNSKVISILYLISMGSFAFLITKYEIVNYEFLYMSQPYKSFGLGIFLRILFYVRAILVSAFVINLVPSKKFNLSKIGGKTMVIYLRHIYLIRLLYNSIPSFNSIIVNLCTIILSSILICVILRYQCFLIYIIMF